MFILTPTVMRRLCCRDNSQSSMGPTWPLNVDASQLRSKICIQPYESQMIIWLFPFVVHFMVASYKNTISLWTVDLIFLLYILSYLHHFTQFTLIGIVLQIEEIKFSPLKHIKWRKKREINHMFMLAFVWLSHLE